MLDQYDFNFDIDGDGIPDSYAELADLDGDGTSDTILVDIDGDMNADLLFSDTDSDGYFDQMMTPFDSDNDGIYDSFATTADINGDGIDETLMIDTDGDAVLDTLLTDTNNDGILDQSIQYIDTNGDGIEEMVVSSDYNQDGIADDIHIYQDIDSDGIFDSVIHQYDSDNDGSIDTFETFYDFDGDHITDMAQKEMLIDTNGDGIADKYVNLVDENGDGYFETTEIYNYDADSETISIAPLNYDDGRVTIDDLENFDPDSTNPDDVIGDPGASMEEWEYQGNSGRCAIYSQKFIIDELTGEDLDIEKLADLAEENGWFTEENGTPLLNMNKLLDYFGIDNEMSFNNDIDDLKDCLESGQKVIVSIDADEIWYGEEDDIFTPGDSANHAVQVIGIDYSDPDNPMVILNDSGNPEGCGEMVPMDAFIDAWEDGGYQMITTI